MPKDITFYEGVQSGYDKLVSKDANGIADQVFAALTWGTL